MEKFLKSVRAVKFRRFRHFGGYARHFVGIKQNGSSETDENIIKHNRYVTRRFARQKGRFELYVKQFEHFGDNVVGKITENSNENYARYYRRHEKHKSEEHRPGEFFENIVRKKQPERNAYNKHYRIGL